MTVAVDLLPRDAELARRAAGGDGAAFVRLYDKHSTEVFTTALAATGSIEAAAEATQTGFLRVLRWPPPLGAPDGDVPELLCALALGGEHAPWANGPADTPEAKAVARLVGVGWLRSETVAEAGARFDADWSVYLWSPQHPATEPEPVRSTLARERKRLRPRLGWLRPRTLRLSPGLAVAGAVGLLLFAAGAGGTILADRGGDEIEAAPTPTEGGRVSPAQRAEVRRADKPPPERSGKAQLLRDKPLAPLLAP